MPESTKGAYFFVKRMLTPLNALYPGVQRKKHRSFIGLGGFVEAKRVA